MKRRSLGILTTSTFLFFFLSNSSLVRGHSEPLVASDYEMQTLEDKISKLEDQIEDWEKVIKSWRKDYGERKSSFSNASIIYTGWSDEYQRPYTAIVDKDTFRYLMFAMHLDKYYGYWLNVDSENWARIRSNAIAQADKMWEYVLDVDTKIRKQEGELLEKLAKHIQEAEAGLKDLKRQKEDFEAQLDKKLGLEGEPEATPSWKQPVTDEDFKSGEALVESAYKEWIRLRTERLNEERRKRNLPVLSEKDVEDKHAYDLGQVKVNLAGPLQKESARCGKAGWAEWKKLVAEVTSLARKAPLGGDPFHGPRSAAIGEFRKRLKKYPLLD